MRVDREEWDRVSELAEDVRVIVASISTASINQMAEENRNLISGVLAQMATLGRTSDIEHHRPTGTPATKQIDALKIKGILGGLSQDVAAVLAEIKEKVGS